jgi:hypothetical protein
VAGRGSAISSEFGGKYDDADPLRTLKLGPLMSTVQYNEISISGRNSKFSEMTMESSVVPVGGSKNNFFKISQIAQKTGHNYANVNFVWVPETYQVGQKQLVNTKTPIKKP